MRRTLLLGISLFIVPLLAGAEQLVSFGEEQTVHLGTSLNRFREIYPQAVRGENWSNEDTTLTTYLLKPPLSIDADEVRFFFDNNLLIQIDHKYSPKRSIERGGWQFDYDALSQLFNSSGQTVTTRESYAPKVKYAFTWKSEPTGEAASLDVYPDGGSLVSFNILPGRTIEDVSPSKYKKAGGVSRLPPAVTPTSESSSSFSPSEEGAALDRALKASRPPKGTIFLQTSTQGHGQLTIDNGSKFDALVKLVSPQRKYTFISVYIHAGRSSTVTNIRPNSYKLIFALGEGWDDSRNAMLRIASTAAFDKLLTFVRSQDQYTSFKVTLHPVVGGNTQTVAIPKEDFLAY